MTIKDIAIKAKVSTGTVDRVIHKRGGVSKRTRTNIKNIIKKNNFKINSVASALAKKKRTQNCNSNANFQRKRYVLGIPFFRNEKGKF